MPDGSVAVLYELSGQDGSPCIGTRVRDPRSDTWGARRILSPAFGPAFGPRLATTAGRAAVAFTRREDAGHRVILAEWPVLAETGLAWA